MKEQTNLQRLSSEEEIAQLKEALRLAHKRIASLEELIDGIARRLKINVSIKKDSGDPTMQIK